MFYVFALRLPRFITNNPYVQLACIVIFFVAQFFSFYGLYKTMRLKKWRDLSKLDKFYKILDSCMFALLVVVLYSLIYIDAGWFTIVPALVYVFLILPRVQRQAERIDNLLVQGSTVVEPSEEG